MPDIGWIAIGSIATALGSIATAIGVWAAFGSLKIARAQIEDSKKIAEQTKKFGQGDFLLRLDAAFPQHWETHLRLRPGGDWSDGENGPKTATEWALVESYMGLFERIQALIEFGIVDLDTFARFYGYRVLNIDNNPIIHNTKLEGEIAKSWADFIKLRDAVRHKRARPTDTMGISTQATEN